MEKLGKEKQQGVFEQNRRILKSAERMIGEEQWIPIITNLAKPQNENDNQCKTNQNLSQSHEKWVGLEDLQNDDTCESIEKVITDINLCNKLHSYLSHGVKSKNHIDTKVGLCQIRKDEKVSLIPEPDLDTEIISTSFKKFSIIGGKQVLVDKWGVKRTVPKNYIDKITETRKAIKKKVSENEENGEMEAIAWLESKSKCKKRKQ